MKLNDESKVGFIKSKLKNFCFYGFDVSSIEYLKDVEKAIKDGHCPAWYLGSRASECKFSLKNVKRAEWPKIKNFIFLNI